MKRYASKWASIIAIIMVVVLSFNTVACTSADVEKAVSQVAAYLPLVIELTKSVASIVMVFSPDSAPKIQDALNKADSAEKELVLLCQSYLAKPDQQVWQRITALIDELVVNGDEQLLSAMQISNPDARQKATVVLASLSAALHTLDAFISVAQPASQVKAKNQLRSAKLKTVISLWSPQDVKQFTARTGIDPLAYVEGL